MKILNGSTASDISGIQDVQSYSPEYNIATQKYTHFIAQENEQKDKISVWEGLKSQSIEEPQGKISCH